MTHAVRCIDAPPLEHGERWRWDAQGSGLVIRHFSYFPSVLIALGFSPTV